MGRVRRPHRPGVTVTDHGGYPVGGAADTAERYDDAVETLLRFGNGVTRAWDATVADDPGFALGQVGRAYLCCLSSEGPDAAAARAILDDLGEPAGLHDREQRHLGAARAYAAGDLAGASDRLAALSDAYPRDALALLVGHQLDFFRGDAARLRDRVGAARSRWDDDDPWFGYVLGMHAFGLEECGQYEDAEAAGMEALDRQRRDVWALHAVVHVHEMQGRFSAGLAFMAERRPDWSDGNFFVVHNSWHEALFQLEDGDVDTPLRTFDTVLHHDGSDKIALEMLDASSLLWRLHLDGVDTGGRWKALADAWAEKDREPWYVFNDVHVVMSFVGADRLDDARSLIARLEAYVADSPSVSNVAMTAEVGLPVAKAILAFGEGRYADAVTLLHPIRGIVHRFGGSHAQRDAFARTLLESAIRAGDVGLAQSLVADRLALNEASPYNWRQLARTNEPGAATRS